MTNFNFYLPGGVVYVEDSLDTKSNKHYLNPGAGITTRVFQSNVHSVDEFQRHQSEKELSFKAFAENFGSGFGARVEVGGSKTGPSLQKKLLEHQGFFRTEEEWGRSDLDHVVCSVHDGLRARFYVAQRNQLVAMVNRLTPSQNGNIVDVKDGFMTLNKIGIPRYKVIYNYQGFNVELVVLHEGMEQALKETDKDHKRQRAMENALGTNTSLQTNWKLVAQLSKEAKKYEASRIETHEVSRKKLLLDRFVVSDSDREFYFHPDDGIFYTQPDPYVPGRPIKALSPNFERGIYMIDNGKTDSISSAEKITKQDFLDLSIGEYSRYCERKLQIMGG